MYALQKLNELYNVFFFFRCSHCVECIDVCSDGGILPHPTFRHQIVKVPTVCDFQERKIVFLTVNLLRKFEVVHHCGQASIILSSSADLGTQNSVLVFRELFWEQFQKYKVPFERLLGSAPSNGMFRSLVRSLECS